LNEVNRPSRPPARAKETPEDREEREQEEFEESLRLPPEVVPLADVDPRIAAAALAPPTSNDLLKWQAGMRDRSDYGNDIAKRLNPLANQMMRDADKAAEGAVPEETVPKTRAQRLAHRTNQVLDHASEYGAPVPQGKNLKEKSQHGLGQGVGLALSYFLPGPTKILRSGLGRKVMAPLIRSRVGQKIPRATWDGLLNKPDPKPGRAGKQGGGKAAKAGKAKPGEGSAQASNQRKKRIAVGASVLACLIFLVFGLLGAGMFSGDDDPAQPEEASDRKVAEYFPGPWQRILQQAANRVEQGGAEDYAVVPWTVLAGVVAAQTDFGRYSPYDNIDRDPGRKAKPIPAPGGGGDEGGGGRLVGSNSSGAGPGPVSGVTGPGSTRTVGERGHVAPPAGPAANQLGWFLYALRMHESGGVYDRPTGAEGSDACGAYQYISTTWRKYRGYLTACEAPPSVQDQRAREDAIKRFEIYGNWQQTAAAHFYPGLARNPSRWHDCPALCGFNPPMWSYVDGVMKKMREAARAHPARGGTPSAPAARGPARPRSASSVAFRADSRAGYGGAATGVFADGCPVASPTPDIGGKRGQGVGPFLLRGAAAAQLRSSGASPGLSLDPQNPCDAATFVAEELSESAEKVHADPKAPRWHADGSKEHQEENRKYWSRVIQNSGIFVERGANPDAPCTLPPPRDSKPWSISFRIISIFRCEVMRLPEMHLVTGVEEKPDGKTTYTVETDRSTAAEILVDEALSVSYGAGKWKSDGCDNHSAKPQGIFPMTKLEAAEAGLKNRCDIDKNITAASQLVLSMEQMKPEERPKKHGSFQPMAGGWQNLGIALGKELEFFSLAGPGRGSFQVSEKCGTVIKEFLTGIAPHAAKFAELEEPPGEAEAYDWKHKLEALEKKHGVEDPSSDKRCVAGLYLPGYNSTLAQVATGLAGGGYHGANLVGLANYFEGMEAVIAGEPEAPVAGKDSLVLPRVTSNLLKPVDVPLAEDATEAWSLLGSTDGVTMPLPQVAVEYAWFFGGVSRPFDSAGERIGSLADGSITTAGTVQVTVGPDGCPMNAPDNTLRGGAAETGISKVCADSVAKARSPQAAMAIKWALTHLGLPYSQPRRNDNGYADCSSFVSKAYRDSNAVPTFYPKATNAPTTHTLREHPQVARIPVSALQPGDLIEPNSGHVVMQLADGYIVHTNRTGDVSHVMRRSFPLTSRLWVGRVDPAKA
jgi:cell wall-associated NlpC family hydrolase